MQNGSVGLYETFLPGPSNVTWSGNASSRRAEAVSALTLTDTAEKTASPELIGRKESWMARMAKPPIDFAPAAEPGSFAGHDLAGGDNAGGIEQGRFPGRGSGAVAQRMGDPHGTAHTGVTSTGISPDSDAASLKGNSPNDPLRRRDAARASSWLGFSGVGGIFRSTELVPDRSPAPNVDAAMTTRVMDEIALLLTCDGQLKCLDLRA